MLDQWGQLGQLHLRLEAATKFNEIVNEELVLLHQRQLYEQIHNREYYKPFYKRGILGKLHQYLNSPGKLL